LSRNIRWNQNFIRNIKLEGLGSEKLERTILKELRIVKIAVLKEWWIRRGIIVEFVGTS